MSSLAVRPVLKFGRVDGCGVGASGSADRATGRGAEGSGNVGDATGGVGCVRAGGGVVSVGAGVAVGAGTGGAAVGLGAIFFTLAMVPRSIFGAGATAWCGKTGAFN